MIVGKELFGAHTVSAPIGAIHRDRHTGQFRDRMAIYRFRLVGGE
jgi:hypothetical protein